MLESQRVSEWSGLTEGDLEEAADVRGMWGMAGCSAWAAGSGGRKGCPGPLDQSGDKLKQQKKICLQAGNDPLS